MIPNGTLANGTMTNYSAKELRRVDFNFSISYDADVEKAKRVIWDVIINTKNVLDEPSPFVRLKEYGSSAVDITTRVWVKNADYWTVYFDMMESIKEEFAKANIEIPYNQLDVHVKNK